MVKHVTAVVEAGALRPLEPLDIPEGRKVEIVVRLVPTHEEIRQRADSLREALDQAHEAAAEFSDEEWEEIWKDPLADRVNGTRSA